MTSQATDPSAPDDDFGGAAVFRRPSGRTWMVSAAAHAGAFLVIAAMGTWLGVKTGVIPRISVVEFETPPRAPTPPPPTPHAPPPQPSAPREATHRATPSAARSAHTGRSIAAPHVLAGAAGTEPGGDSMPVGEGTDLTGGTVGGGGGDAPAQPDPTPPEAPPRRGREEEVAPENLSVRAAVECDDVALARLYPQEAVDNEIEVSVLPVEMLVDAAGTIVRAHARSDPGFGVASAMERGVLAHCRVTTVARDRAGDAAAMRVVKRIRFQFE